VSTGAQASEVASYADGVIVGSAFIDRILRATDHQAALDSVRELATELAAGVRGAN
jgi:tryptophan synthase alpha chain